MKLFILGITLSLTCLSFTKDFVSIKEIHPDIEVEARYHGDENFVGSRVDGYLAPKCILSAQAAKALARAQEYAANKGLGLKVFDCYRPQMAVDHFVRWAKDLKDIKKKDIYYPNVKKERLFEEGYIAAKSGHSRGSTVDLTLVLNGEELPMGTPFDFFDPLSHTENPSISQAHLKNRVLLKEIMTAAGFKNYSKEWWHYTLRDEPYTETYFSFPVK